LANKQDFSKIKLKSHWQASAITGAGSHELLQPFVCMKLNWVYFYCIADSTISLVVTTKPQLLRREHTRWLPVTTHTDTVCLGGCQINVWCSVSEAFWPSLGLLYCWLKPYNEQNRLLTQTEIVWKLHTLC